MFSYALYKDECLDLSWSQAPKDIKFYVQIVTLVPLGSTACLAGSKLVDNSSVLHRVYEISRIQPFFDFIDE
jgi:hypothetical protein